MDFLTFVLLVIAIGAGLLAIKMIAMDAPGRNNDYYLKGIDAEISLLSRVHITIHGDTIVWATVKDGSVVVEHLRVRPVGEQPAKITPAEPITEDELKELEQWQLALKLVQESVRAGANTNRIIPATVFSSGTKWSEACAPLKTKGWIRSIKGGKQSKTEVNAEVGTVSDLLLRVVTEIIERGGRLPETSTINQGGVA